MYKVMALFSLLVVATVAGFSLFANETETANSRPARAIQGIETSQRIDDPDEPNLYDGFTGYTRDVTTDSEEAQKWFNQGIQLLYGYNHDEAIRSFEKAASIDPSCAMAWWGSAYARGLHINNPQMGEEQSRLAFEAAEKALKALDDESDLERDLVEAVARRYSWPAPEDRSPLDQDYADAMEAAWHRNPNDPDVGALFAESLMNLQPWDLWTHEGAPKGRTLEIVAVLQQVLEHTPKHPGANHFFIHAIEASPWPELGLPSAERLVDLVPGSGHLVHMPSHIFIRVGKYDEAVAANQRAIEADEAYFARAPKPGFYSLYFMHNIHFLAYAAMMEARYETALEASIKIEKTIPPEFLREYVTLADGFMTTKLHVLIRFGKWNEILEEPEPDAYRLFSRAERFFARSVALSALGEPAKAREELEKMELVASEMSDEWRVGNNSAHDVLEIARKMALGEIAFREKRSEEAFQLLAEAVEGEEQLAYDEPPGWMQPVRHALGALLLADGRSKESESVYRQDLVRHPNNAWALLGLQQSLAHQGKTQQAAEIAELVQLAWARSDVTPIASCYCHPDARESNE